MVAHHHHVLSMKPLDMMIVHDGTDKHAWCIAVALRELGIVHHASVDALTIGTAMDCLVLVPSAWNEEAVGKDWCEVRCASAVECGQKRSPTTAAKAFHEALLHCTCQGHRMEMHLSLNAILKIVLHKTAVLCRKQSVEVTKARVIAVHGIVRCA